MYIKHLTDHDWFTKKILLRFKNLGFVIRNPGFNS